MSRAAQELLFALSFVRSHMTSTSSSHPVARFFSVLGIIATLIALFGYFTGQFTFASTLDWLRSLKDPNRSIRQAPRFVVAEHSCPGEAGCIFTSWKVTKPAQIYERPDPDNPVPTFRVSAGETVEGVTAQILSKKPGRIRVINSTVSRANEETDFSVRAGDELPVYYYLGEGCWRAWYKGSLRDLCVNATVLSEPEISWWVKIKDSLGRQGWSNTPGSFCGVTRYDECN